MSHGKVRKDVSCRQWPREPSRHLGTLGLFNLSRWWGHLTTLGTLSLSPHPSAATACNIRTYRATRALVSGFSFRLREREREVISFGESVPLSQWVSFPAVTLSEGDTQHFTDTSRPSLKIWNLWRHNFLSSPFLLSQKCDEIVPHFHLSPINKTPFFLNFNVKKFHFLTYLVFYI